METNIVQETLEKGVKKLYDKLEAELPEIQKCYDADDVTTFIAQCGRDYTLKKTTELYSMAVQIMDGTQKNR